MKKLTTKSSKKLIVANWKMNPTDGKTALSMFKKIQTTAHKYGKFVETVVCPPSVYLQSLQAVVTDRSCVLGAQDCFYEAEGSHTGEISPVMVFNAKARYVILGHSERRALGETNEIVNKKMQKILQYPLSVILCVGEKKRVDNKSHINEVKKQVKECLKDIPVSFYDRIVIAYEPTWAIGKDAKRAATAEECFEMITIIRRTVSEMLNNPAMAHSMRVMYGASSNSENTEELLTKGGADGLLVGRASMDPKEFGKMISIASKV